MFKMDPHRQKCSFGQTTIVDKHLSFGFELTNYYLVFFIYNHVQRSLKHPGHYLVNKWLVLYSKGFGIVMCFSPVKYSLFRYILLIINWLLHISIQCSFILDVGTCN